MEYASTSQREVDELVNLKSVLLSKDAENSRLSEEITRLQKEVVDLQVSNEMSSKNYEYISKEMYNLTCQLTSLRKHSNNTHIERTDWEIKFCKSEIENERLKKELSEALASLKMVQEFNLNREKYDAMYL